MNPSQNPLESLWQLTSKAFRPPPNLSLVEWADTTRRLSSETSAESGQWRTSRAPFMAEPMEAISDRRTREVVVMSSAQVGKTELLLNTAGYYIDQDPSPILCIQPTLESARDWSRTKLSAMLRDSIPGRVEPPRRRDSDNTALFKKFAGGFIGIAGSNSVAGLAGRSIRVLLLDEISRYAETTVEGNSVELAMKRTTTFSNSKIVAVSTPTWKGCLIENWYHAGSAGQYYVPCPHCGERQVLLFANVKWDKGQPHTAVYQCESGCVIEHKDKPRMLSDGEWLHDNPENERTRSFRLNECYSPWRTWEDMSRDFLRTKNEPELLQVFINTSLGESFDPDQGHVLQFETFLERREPYTITSVPQSALVVTAGIDVQRDRCEVTFIAWGDDFEAWVLDHRVIWGNAAQGEVWNELDEQLQSTIRTVDGRELNVQCACIDSGGHWTENVYAWTRPRAGRRIFAVKGSSQPAQPIVSRPSIVGRSRVPLYSVGTDTAKMWIHGRLPSTEPPAMIHFSQILDDEYFRQLTAEKMVERKVGNTVRMSFKKTRARNESLDAFVYALCAVNILSPNFTKLANRGTPTTEVEPVVQPTVDQQLRPRRPRFKKRSWVNNW